MSQCSVIHSTISRIGVLHHGNPKTLYDASRRSISCAGGLTWWTVPQLRVPIVADVRWSLRILSLTASTVQTG